MGTDSALFLLWTSWRKRILGWSVADEVGPVQRLRACQATRRLTVGHHPNETR